MLFLCFLYIAQSSKIFCSIYCKYLCEDEEIYAQIDHVQSYIGRHALSWSQIPFLAMGLAPAQSLHYQNAYGRNVEQVQISVCTQSFSYSPTPFIVINMLIKGLLRSTPESTRPCWSGFAHPVSAPLTKRGRTESETSGVMCPYLCYPFRMVIPKQLRSDS